jgi:hypothetical protein
MSDACHLDAPSGAIINPYNQQRKKDVTGVHFDPVLQDQDRLSFGLPEEEVPGRPEQSQNQGSDQRADTSLQLGQCTSMPASLFPCGIEED